MISSTITSLQETKAIRAQPIGIFCHVKFEFLSKTLPFLLLMRFFLSPSLPGLLGDAVCWAQLWLLSHTVWCHMWCYLRRERKGKCETGAEREGGEGWDVSRQPGPREELAQS